MDIVSEAVNLVQRYQKGDAFRRHVEERQALVGVVILLFLAFSIALSLGTVAALDKTALRGFLGVVLMPIVLIGSLTAQAYLFFSWLELRALKPMLAHGSETLRSSRLADLRARLGKAPPIPWVTVAVLLVLPLLFLAMASVKIAALILVLAILTPIGYAHFDR